MKPFSKGELPEILNMSQASRNFQTSWICLFDAWKEVKKKSPKFWFHGDLPWQNVKNKKKYFNKAKITTFPKLLECESLGILSLEGTRFICATLTTNIAVQETFCAPQIGLVEKKSRPN